MDKEYHSLTAFRANIYSMVDELLATGEPVLLSRNDRVIEVREKPSKSRKKSAKNVKKRDLSKIIPLPNIMTEDPDWYISPKLHEWKPDDFL